MDIALYLRVFWRFKLLVGGGFVLAVALSVLAVAKVSLVGGSPKLTPRGSQQWSSHATLFVTQQGFPWGRTVTPYLPGNTATGKPSVPTSDLQRMSSLTGLYAQLANADPVQRRLKRSAPPGTLTVTAVPAPPYVYPAIEPLLDLQGTAATPAAAVKLTNSAASAFQAWLRDNQQTAGIPEDQRILVQVVKHATPATLTTGRGKTLPLLVFMTIMTAVCGLAFVLENLRPRVRKVEGSAAVIEPTRRTA